MRLVLYQPDIPQNAGALVRLAACLGLGVDVIAPCGFVWDDRKMRRAGMDYRHRADLRHHASWAHYQAAAPAGRLLLLTTRGAVRYTEVAYAPEDRLLLGRESAGVPEAVHDAATLRLVIPVRDRSLNVVQAAAMVAGEALRQTDGWPPEQEDPARS